MFLLSLSMMSFAAHGVPEAARAEQLFFARAAAPHKAVHHAAKPHVSAPRKSPVRSTPRHKTSGKPKAAVHKTTPAAHKSTAHKTVAHRPTTRAFRQPITKNTTINKNVNVNKTVDVFSTRIYAGRHRHHRSYFYGRHSYTRGMYGIRSSRYSRRHVRRRSGQNGQQIVRGVIDGTTGNAATGSVQVKMLPNARNRFQYGVAVVAPMNAKVNSFNVSNQTGYAMVTNARGGTKVGGFKDLAPGEPVVIVTPRGGNNFASAIEIFPLK